MSEKATPLFCYNGNVSQVADGDSETITIEIGREDFLLKELRFTKVDTAAEVYITPSISGGDQLSENALDANLLGEDKDSLKFFDPDYRFEAKTKIFFKVENNSGAALDYEVQMWGKKL